jgi:hypothetical protein
MSALPPESGHRHLRARLSTVRGGAALRCTFAAKEDPPHSYDRTLICVRWTHSAHARGTDTLGVQGSHITDNWHLEDNRVPPTSRAVAESLKSLRRRLIKLVATSGRDFGFGSIADTIPTPQNLSAIRHIEGEV